VAGQREEHIVERRAAQREVVDADAGLAQPAHSLDDRPAARAHVHFDEVAVGDGRLI